jgi:DNA gyrase/topoisomerase IV subunit B
MDEITKGSRKKVLAADKLKDCLESGEKAWLAITEGDSAQGALNLGRDIETVATFPIRGKFINCLKNKQEDYLDNEELIQLAQILGCGILDKFSSRNLRYGNILIAVDADSDGLNIACLLITFFYVCMPQLLKEGRVYWMRAPLYSKPGDYIFTEEEWAKVKNKKGYKRNKGLGEMLPQEVEEAMFGKFKRWEQLRPTTWLGFKKIVEDLMGKDVENRRDFLFKNVDFERVKFL